MAGALLGSPVPIATWSDEQGRAAIAAGNSGLLPQDAFARQPIVSDDLVFAAQARIDNRIEILERLGMRAAEASKLADCDVLHLAYRTWGEACVQELTGDYAFVAWHRNSDRVVAATDHLGSSKIFYSDVGGKFVAATQMGALLAHPMIPRDLNFDALGLLIAPNIKAGATAYRHVRLLPGGHLLRYERGALTQYRWWNPDVEIRARYRNPQDYVLHAREVLDRAVSACLRATSRVAATVSGGLDSTLIASAAALQLGDSGQRLLAFTAVPEPGLLCQPYQGWESDDSIYARSLAQMHENIDLDLISPGGLCTLDILPAIHARSHTPLRNGANHIWIGRIYEAARQNGARVVLIGAKGNATTSQTGDGAIGALLNQLRWRAAFQLASGEARDGIRPLWRNVLRHIFGEHGRTLASRLRKGSPRLGRHLMTSSFRTAHAMALEEPFATGTTRSRQIAFAKSPAKFWLADPMPQWNVEVRDPLGDRRLIECLLGFPPEAFALGGRGRGLARAMGDGRVPDTIRLRRTKGEQMSELLAIIATHEPSYREALDKVAASPAFCSIVEVDLLRGLVDRVCSATGSRIDALTLDRALDVGLFISSTGE